MQSDIKNERFILISDNLSFKEFQDKTAKILGVVPAKKEASKFLLEMGWRLDWLNHKLLGKRRRLSKQVAKTARTKTFYDNSKIKNALGFEFSAIDNSLETVCAYFIKDQRKS